MLTKNKNIKIIFAFFVALIISFSVLFIFLENEYRLNSISKEEISFYSQFPNHEKNIFIIGSSHLMALNSTYMNDILSEKDVKYKIYNLAKGSDFPKLRIDSIDLIISANPDLVFYGIGYRDFVNFSDTSIGSFRSYTSPPNPILEPKNLIENHILKTVGYYSLNFDFLENPKSKTIKSIKKIFLNSENLMNDEKQFQRLLYLPLWQYEIINSEAIAHFEVNTQSEINKKYVDKDLSADILIGEKHTDRNIQSLRYMIDKLTKNKINVVLVMTPHNKVLFDNTLPEERLPFNSTMTEISQEFDIPLYSFLEIYKNENIWYNFDHIAINKNKLIFEDDFINVILSEVR